MNMYKRGMYKMICIGEVLYKRGMYKRYVYERYV